MHTQGIRLQLKQMDESVHSIIARAALDELLFKAGSGFHKLTNEEVTGVIAGCIQAYNELFKEENDETRSNQTGLKKVS